MNKEEAKWWIEYLEQRKRFWQKEIRIVDRKILQLKAELICKEDCVYRDPKAKVPPFCRYGDREVIIINDVCKTYIKEPI